MAKTTKETKKEVRQENQERAKRFFSSITVVNRMQQLYHDTKLDELITDATDALDIISYITFGLAAYEHIDAAALTCDVLNTFFTVESRRTAALKKIADKNKLAEGASEEDLNKEILKVIVAIWHKVNEYAVEDNEVVEGTEVTAETTED